VELEKVLDGAGAHIVGVETSGESGWTVMDAFDVMIHVFSKELRSRYNLEKLWRDAHEVSVDRLLSRTPVTSRKKAAKPRKNAVKPKKKPPAKRKKTSK
jgi:ribosome-associated protein